MKRRNTPPCPHEQARRFSAALRDLATQNGEKLEGLALEFDREADMIARWAGVWNQTKDVASERFRDDRLGLRPHAAARAAG